MAVENYRGAELVFGWSFYKQGEMEPLFLAVICGCNAGLFREARICYERAEPLCHSLNHHLLCLALRGQFLYSLHNKKLTAAMRIAKRVHTLAREQNNAALPKRPKLKLHSAKQ
jgi:hypothetical protein